MFKERVAGILLHPTSLPGKMGVGSFGAEAFRLIDWMSECGLKVWQILPLGPTNESFSPYQSYSAFAGNPDLIDLDELIEAGLLSSFDFTELPSFPVSRINFGKAQKFREPLLRLAFERFLVRGGFQSETYLSFYRENSWWLDTWSLFDSCRMALSLPWNCWETALRDRDRDALLRYSETYASEIAYRNFLQFIFFKQWYALKSYANSRGVLIFGDVPLYVSFDSADVWSNQKLFLLDSEKAAAFEAGVPPDYFSETGQCWGTPVYDWEAHRSDGYSWWMARLHFNIRMYDRIRIDHFRGLESFWAIPGGRPATEGNWIRAYGDEMLALFQSQTGQLPVVAEDLGSITPEVEALRNRFELPGMKVVQFAFSSDATNEHLPHNYTRSCVAYTGTHDNNTTAGWLSSLKQEERNNLSSYVQCSQPDHWSMIAMVLGSVANWAIIPVQDLAGLGEEARFNTPGTTKGNWQWRFNPAKISKKSSEKLISLLKIFGRSAQSR